MRRDPLIGFWGVTGDAFELGECRPASENPAGDPQAYQRHMAVAKDIERFGEVAKQTRGALSRALDADLLTTSPQAFRSELGTSSRAAKIVHNHLKAEFDPKLHAGVAEKVSAARQFTIAAERAVDNVQAARVTNHGRPMAAWAYRGLEPVHNAWSSASTAIDGASKELAGIAKQAAPHSELTGAGKLAVAAAALATVAAGAAGVHALMRD